MQVTLEHHTHAFAIQSLHHAYHVFGYEGALRHLHVYHGLQTMRLDSAKDCAKEPAKDLAKEPTKDLATVSNEVISYTRTNVPEAGRCTKVLSNGNQCTFHKSGDSDLCARHSKDSAVLPAALPAVSAESKEEKAEEKVVVVTEDKKEKQRAYQAAYREKHKKST